MSASERSSDPFAAASRADVAELKADLIRELMSKADAERLEGKIDRIDERTRALATKAESEQVRTGQERLRADLTAAIGQMRTDLTAEVGLVRTDLTAAMGQMRTDVTGETGSLRTDIKALEARTGWWLLGVAVLIIVGFLMQFIAPRLA